MSEQVQLSKDKKSQESPHNLSYSNQHRTKDLAAANSEGSSIVDSTASNRRQAETQEMMNNSLQVKKGASIQSMIDSSPSMVVQRKKNNELFNGQNLQYPASDPIQMKKEDEKVKQFKATDHSLSSGPEKSIQIKGVGIKEDEELEKEADEMGEKVSKEKNNPNKPNSSSGDYRQRVMNSVEYKNFKESPNSPLDKWEQFHSQGETEYEEGLDEHVHITSDNNNTYTSLALKYQISLQEILNLNQNLIKQRGNFIPSGSHVFVFARKNLLDEFPQHLIYEFVAHHLVYKQAYTPFNKEESAILGKAGYVSRKELIIWKTGDFGFQALLIRSNRPGLNDLIAFRGTHPGTKSSDLLTIVTDSDPKAVGANQFAINKGKIENDLLPLSKGKIDVTGHSLGGAMAQHVAANFAGKIGNVVTFQSPGIDQQSVDKFDKIPGKERPQVVHHFMKGDQVDKAGDAKLPGLNIEHDFGIQQTLPSEIIENFKGRFGGIKYGLIEFERDFKDACIIPAQLMGIPTQTPASFDEAVRMLDNLTPSITSFYRKGELLNKLNYKMYEMNNDLEYALGHATELINFVKGVVASEGEAHLKRVFSAEQFASYRKEAGISDEFMLRPTDDTLRKKGVKNPVGGMEVPKEELNEHSTQMRYEGDAYSSERLIAENIRSGMGKVRDKSFTLDQIVSFTQTIEKIVNTIQAIKEIINKIEGFLSSGTVPGTDLFDKLKEYTGKLWEQMQNISIKI